MTKIDDPTPRSGGSGLFRRDFLTLSGLALGAGAAAPILGRSRPARAATEIIFASAKFFGKETIAQLVEAYNATQDTVHVTYRELPPPSASTEVHQALVQQLARRNGAPDVFTQDIIWIAEFAAAGWSLPLDEHVDAGEVGAYFPGLVAGCQWQGKLVALPWFVDSGMLYYRRDLLDAAGAEVPETWPELVETAKAITRSGQARLGFLWQGKQAEVLVCDLVSFTGSNGGAILDADGRTVRIADPATVEAVQLMHDTIAVHKISPPDLLSWDEEPSRRPFTAGQAVFLRNWSYVYGIAQDASESSVVGKVGVAPLPHFPGKASAASLGGYQYGINASSKNKEAAIDFVRWMSSPETQLRFAIQLGLAPTRQAVFDHPDLVAAQPFMAQLKPVFLGATPRPVTPKYPQVSLVLQSEVSKALAGGDVQGTLDSARSRIEAIITG